MSERYKRIYVKINVDGKVVRHQFCAPAGKWYDEDDIKRNRGSVMQWLKDQSPNRIFSEVQIGPNQFNYIATGTRANESQESHEEAAKESGPVDSPRQESK